MIKQKFLKRRCLATINTLRGIQTNLIKLDLERLKIAKKEQSDNMNKNRLVKTFVHRQNLC